jgi:hypothetical protein
MLASRLARVGVVVGATTILLLVSERPSSAQTTPAATATTTAKTPTTATPDRKLGTCSAGGSICGGPSASASFVILDLSNGTSKGGFVPAAGYGVTFMANEWYNFGVSLYASYVAGANGPAVFTPLLVGSFAEYLRIGIGLDRTSAQTNIPGKTDVIMVFGLGLDFGSTPSSQGLGVTHAIGVQ